jgi:hypothetical protein
MKFAIYGGRIDNDHDMRVLVTYLGLFFHQDVLSSSGYDAPNHNNAVALSTYLLDLRNQCE